MHLVAMYTSSLSLSTVTMHPGHNYRLSKLQTKIVLSTDAPGNAPSSVSFARVGSPQRWDFAPTCCPVQFEIGCLPRENLIASLKILVCIDLPGNLEWLTRNRLPFCSGSLRFCMFFFHFFRYFYKILQVICFWSSTLFVALWSRQVLLGSF